VLFVLMISVTSVSLHQSASQQTVKISSLQTLSKTASNFTATYQCAYSDTA